MIDLTTLLAPSLTLPTPILAASGTFGFGDELAGLADPRYLGALITPTLTLTPRDGNPMPRTAETSAGLLHATGLPNPGLTGFLADIAPRLPELPCPVIVNILGETAEEWEELAEAVSVAGVAALELNLTPPQLLFAEASRNPLPPENVGLTRLSTAVSAARKATTLPLLAKLPAIGVETGAAARAVVEAGADVVCVGQAFPGAAVRLSERKFRFPGVVGGLSGPAIKPLALYAVWRAAQAVAVPIIGGGGVMTAEDALEFFLAGASAVTVGTATLIHPAAIAGITEDLRRYLQARQLSSLQELIGEAG